MSHRYELNPVPRLRQRCRSSAIGGFRMWALLALALCGLAAARPALAQGPPGYEYWQYPTYHPHVAADPQRYPNQYVEPELLPQDRGPFYDNDSRLDLLIRDSLRGAFMRIEYLNWDIKQPGSNRLGAPIANVDHPTEPFLLQTPTGTLAAGEVLSTQSVDFRNINGIRGTVGIPLEGGGVEAAIWGLNKSFDDVQDRPFLRNNSDVAPRFIAVSLLSNGQPGSRLLLFDRSFNANYSANAWGSDINFFYDQASPREGISLQPLIGGRYLSYDERLKMVGQFDNSSGTFSAIGTLANPIESQIRSNTNNSVYSLQTGFRSEFRHRFFTLGVEPKVAFGANDYHSRVLTSNLRDFDDPTVTNGPFDVDDPPNATNPNPTHSSSGRLLFTPTLDLGVYARINLTDWAHLTVGYNYMLSGNIVRANRAIDYNDRGIDQDPAVKSHERAGSLWIQGLTVGGEILLP